jgi:predicted TIM-barrel fold metal-dependent hydrolase
MMAHMASLIFGGVFEKYPTLKVVMQEGGVLWIAPYLWKLDQDWKGLRFQTRLRPVYEIPYSSYQIANKYVMDFFTDKKRFEQRAPRCGGRNQQVDRR